MNGALFFRANDGIHGRELWTSDGTEEGTRLVKDINPSPAGSSPDGVGDYGHELVNGNGTLYFSADDGADGFELWKREVAAAVTQLLKDINPGAASSNPHYLTYVSSNARSRLFFAATEPDHGTELWWSDGTEQGTALYQDILPGPDGSGAERLTAVNG